MRRQWAIGMAAAVALAGLVPSAWAGYVADFSSATVANDFVVAQVGQTGNHLGGSNATPVYDWTGSRLQLTGQWGPANGTLDTGLDDNDNIAAVVLTAGGSMTGDGQNAGVFEDTDAVLTFSLIGSDAATIDFGMSNRQAETNSASTINRYPLYRVDYVGAGTTGSGMLAISEQAGYITGAPTILDSAAVNLGGLDDTYVLELSTVGQGAATVLTATLSDNGTVLATLTGMPSLGISAGQVGIYAAAQDVRSYSNGGIEVTGFSVNAAAAVPEPGALGMLVVGGGMVVVGGGMVVGRRRRGGRGIGK